MRIPKPTPIRFKDELDQSNLFGASIFDLLTTQHFAHGADLFRTFCQETGRDPDVLKVSLPEIVDWLDTQPTFSSDKLEDAARRVALEVFFQIQTGIATNPSCRRSVDDHVDPYMYDWLAQDEQLRRDEFNSVFSSQFQQDALI